MYNFAIGIPTVNRYDLLKPVLEKYLQNKYLEVVVLDNGKQNIIPAENLFVHAPPLPLSVAQSWNTLLDAIFSDHDKDFALILNDDIDMGEGMVSNVRFIIDCLYPDNGMKILFKSDPEFEWSAFLISKDFYNTIGSFDEAFIGAYFEDKDYEHRAARHPDTTIIYTCLLNPVVYNKSMSIAKDETLNENYQHNQDYFIKKWGDMPDSPFNKYKTPFNR